MRGVFMQSPSMESAFSHVRAVLCKHCTSQRYERSDAADSSAEQTLAYCCTQACVGKAHLYVFTRICQALELKISSTSL